MNILVLNGSPKKDKSDTMHITRAFLDGMNDISPQNVKTINVIDCHIEYCTGCFACMHNGGTCRYDDDMRKILEEILESDLLLLSFPLYCYGMPASLKALLERTLPLSSMAMKKVGDRYEHVGQRDYSRLKYLMICGCGFPNSRHNFEPASAQFRLMFPERHTVITVPESPMFNSPEASSVTVPRLELVRRAGRQYAKAGAIDEELLSDICSPMIPEDTYAKIVNGKSTNMKNTVIYVHGKGGSADEAEHYRSLFPESDVIGFDYSARTPWEAAEEFPRFFAEHRAQGGRLILAANSIGAFFSMFSLDTRLVDHAYLISPVVDMEKLIRNMMKWSKVTENELEEKSEIKTDFGETLSWEYLRYVREHPISWNVPTEILYGERDDLTDIETMSSFAEKVGANLTVMPGGEHWFHTEEQMRFLDDWIKSKDQIL